ncbi:hypothetical protein MMYC01_201230 [Madurella mycetomatis]|uniref:DUF8021 domain-containing protein n=1 Tax=Madurella mycetomatis TaxID=100816 RepID=A0A175WHG9_9PEZI|nr:hypothetical protein MMYC01_201230 [Madurella mycetomatis]
MPRPRLLTLLSAIILAPAAHSQAVRCQWASLRSATDVFIESQAAGASSDPIFSSLDLQYTQNGKPLTINSSESLLSTPFTVQHSHTLIDQDTCASFTKLILVHSENAEERLLLGAQIHFNMSTTDARLTRVHRLDVVYVGEGDWKMENFTAAAAHVEGEDWGALSRGAQDTRETLEAVAEAYLDLLGGIVGDAAGAAVVPWGRPCARLEGSVYTAGEESCVEGLSLPLEGGAEGITERKYVMDASVGSVSVVARDGSLGGAPTVLELRVLQGELRYVHQFTATEGVKAG